jgi:hypothetical protein
MKQIHARLIYLIKKSEEFIEAKHEVMTGEVQHESEGFISYGWLGL